MVFGDFARKNWMEMSHKFPICSDAKKYYYVYTFGFRCGGGFLFKTSVYFCLGFPASKMKIIPHMIGTHMFFSKLVVQRTN